MEIIRVMYTNVPQCIHLATYTFGWQKAERRGRINREPVVVDVVRFARVTRANPASSNPNELALSLDYPNGFLFGIKANRVNVEMRERLITCPRECYHVLSEQSDKPGHSTQRRGCRPETGDLA